MRCGFAVVGLLAAVVGLIGCGQTISPSPSNAPPAPSQDASAAAPAEPIVMAEADPHPVVVLHTSKGDVKLRLDRDLAPRTVANFLTYVRSGHYNQTIFHQVDAGYVIVGGTFTADFAERSGRYAIRSEADNGLQNKRGSVAMARALDDADSATCQFFLNLADNPGLDHQGSTPEEFGFCVFGEVIEGLDVLDKIAETPVTSNEHFEKAPIETVLIERAEYLR